MANDGKPPLHVVPDGAQAPSPATDPYAQEDLVEAVASGSTLRILKAQQRDVAQLLHEGAGAQTAQLHRTLTSLTQDIRDYVDLVGVQERTRTPDEKFKGA